MKRLAGFDTMKARSVNDPVIAAFRQHVDLSLLRENLKLTPAQRLAKLQSAVAFTGELRRAGRRMRDAEGSG